MVRRLTGLVAGFVVLAACSVLTSLDQLAPTDAGVDASLDSKTNDDGSAQQDAAADGAPKPYAFSDGFDRADTDAGLGNAWVAKGPTLAVRNKAAMRVVNDGNEYQDNIQTRPVGESVGDVEVSVELTLATVAPCSPQIHARVDTSTVSLPSTLDSYIFYLDNDGTYTHWIVGRQHGGQPLPDTVDMLTATAAVEANVPVRLTLRVQGTNPVTLTGTVERMGDGGWETLASHASSDATGLRIEKAGVVGLGTGKGNGYETTGQYSYDNFSAKSL